MDKLRQTLEVIFYLIWIPLGILLLAGIIYLIAANPFAGMMELMSGGGGLPLAPSGDSFGPPGGQGSPSEEQIRQFIEHAPPGQ